MDALTFIQAQHSISVLLDDLNIIIGGFGLVDQPRSRFTGSVCTKEKEKQNDDRHPYIQKQLLPPLDKENADEGNDHQQAADDEKGTISTHIGDEHQHRQKGADERTQRGNGVDPSGNLAGLGGIRNGQADGKGRCSADEGDGDDEQNHHDRERSEKHPQL